MVSFQGVLNFAFCNIIAHMRKFGGSTGIIYIHNSREQGPLFQRNHLSNKDELETSVFLNPYF